MVMVMAMVMVDGGVSLACDSGRDGAVVGKVGPRQILFGLASEDRVCRVGLVRSLFGRENAFGRLASGVGLLKSVEARASGEKRKWRCLLGGFCNGGRDIYVSFQARYGKACYSFGPFGGS